MKLNNITLSVVNEEKQELVVELISGALTSKYKLELDDGEVKLAKKAVEDFHWTREFLVNREFPTINDFDQFLYTIDATSTKRSIGVNVFLVLSVGFFKILAKEKGLSDREFFRFLSQNRKDRELKIIYSLKTALEEFRELFPIKNYFLITAAYLNIREYKKRIIQKAATVWKELKDSDEKILKGFGVLEEINREMGLEGCKFGVDLENSEVGGGLLELIKTKEVVYVDNSDELRGDDTWALQTSNKQNIFDQVKTAGERNINCIVIDPSKIGAVSELIQVALLARNKDLRAVGRFDKDREFLKEMSEGLGLDGEILV